MKLKDLKRKLALINDDCDDMLVTIDCGALNQMYAQSVVIGDDYNIIIATGDEWEDVEDDKESVCPECLEDTDPEELKTFGGLCEDCSFNTDENNDD